MAKAPAPWKKKGLVLCEGPTDKGFLEMLFTVDPPDFHLRKPSDNNLGDGVDNFGAFLSGAADATDFKTSIKRIVLLFDNDNNAAVQFATVIRALKRANTSAGAGHFPVPRKANQIAKNKNYWLCCIAIPSKSRLGSLESMVLKVLEKKHSAKIKCAESMFACATHGQTWPEHKKAKALLVSVCAHINRKKPSAPLGFQLAQIKDEMNLDHRDVKNLIKAITKVFA